MGIWLGSVFGAGPARADGAVSGGDVTVAQSLGDRELTVIVRRAEPGPLRVDVVTHAGTPPGRLTLGVVATDRDGAPGSATVELTDRLGPYPVTLRVDHAGPWELTIFDGERTARIPFLVYARVVTPWERAAYGGFCTAGAMLLVALGTALISRRGWVTLVPAGAFLVALSVAVTGAVLSGHAPAPRPPGSRLDPTSDNVGNPFPERDLPLTVNYSRPPVNMTVLANGPADIRLALTDSATGRPVDDLLVNDDALLHLMVVGPDGRLWHRHPIRVAPGDYRISVRGGASGEYAFAAEIARRGGGVQLLRAAARLDASVAAPAMPTASGEPGTAGPGDPITPGPGNPATPGVKLTASDPVAGEPATLTAQFGGGADLQLWLGMVGHLIAVGPLPDRTPTGTAAATAPIWAHAHAMAPLPPAGAQPADETVAKYGPTIDFTFTFAQPGRYLVWAQAERDYSVLTLPAVVDVRTGGPR
ncbi:hypothetical protein ACFVUS_23995 [Nocardia sp. NPDC058058]|uniref:hypothetical protein n=1 Tax=Nocardia sp. NPDC058058 TaxID=3346317 RepID=UPI0036DF54E3